MNKYVGVKVLEHAEPMTRIAYNEFRGWKLPEGEDEGYLVVYNNDGESNTIKYKGYVSWSPKKQFEEGYILLDDDCKITQSEFKETIEDAIYCEKLEEFDFGVAVSMLKTGHKMGRKGWNGKGMWLEIQTPYEHSKMTRPYLYHVSKKGSTNHYGADVKDIERTPWLPSNSDILSSDWVIVE